MPNASKILESTFNVDLLALAWIAVAITVLTLLGWYFYDGLRRDEDPGVRPNPAPTSRQARFLVLYVALWWTMDTLWHSRSIIVTPPFWHPLVSVSQKAHILPPLIEGLWAKNPVAWDFSLLVINASLICMIAVTWSRTPRYLMIMAAIWGVLRWALTGFIGTATHEFSILGPGGYLLAGGAAYLVLFPEQSRSLLALLFGALSLEMLLTIFHTTGIGFSLGLSIGFAGLIWGMLRHWPPLTFRVLLIIITIDALSHHLGTAAYHEGLNDLIEPAILALGWSLHMNVHSRTNDTHLGG